MKRLALLIALLGLVGLLAVVFGTPVVGNLLGTVMEAGYDIPVESSLWRFHATRMNEEGSGEYWLYGEDSVRFYQSMDDGKVLSIRRDEASKVAGFDPRDVETWPAYPSSMKQAD